MVNGSLSARARAREPNHIHVPNGEQVASGSWLLEWFVRYISILHHFHLLVRMQNISGIALCVHNKAAEKKKKSKKHLLSFTVINCTPLTSFLFRLSHYLTISGQKIAAHFFRLEQVFLSASLQRSYLVVFIVIKYLTFAFLSSLSW